MASRRVIRKTMVLLGGAALLLLGAIGIIVPIMPGFLFLIAALLLMSTEFEWAERALESARTWIATRRSDRPQPGGFDIAQVEESKSVDDRTA